MHSIDIWEYSVLTVNDCFPEDEPSSLPPFDQKMSLQSAGMETYVKEHLHEIWWLVMFTLFVYCWTYRSFIFIFNVEKEKEVLTIVEKASVFTTSCSLKRIRLPTINQSNSAKVDLLIHPSLAAAAAAAASSSRMMSASPPSHSHSPPSNGASSSNGGGPSSDACNGIVANLLCHRQRTNGESETFAKRAIER